MVCIGSVTVIAAICFIPFHGQIKNVVIPFVSEGDVEYEEYSSQYQATSSHHHHYVEDCFMNDLIDFDLNERVNWWFAT